MSSQATVQGFAREMAQAASLRHLLHRKDYRILVSATSKDLNPKITILLIPAETSATAVVVKVPLSDIAQAAVDREGEVLNTLPTIDHEQLSSTLPRVVGTVELENRRALLMTAVSGVPMANAYNRWRHTASRRKVTRDFCMAEQWLRLLWNHTQRGRAPVDLDGGICARLALRFSGDPSLGAVLEGLGALHEDLGQRSGPLTAVHGDFWYGNLLTLAGRISGVVDWESGTSCGQPVGDLARFALSYALYLDRHTAPGRSVRGHPGLSANRWGDGIRYAMSGDGWFADTFRGFLRRGLACLGLPQRLWWMVALCGIAEVAANADHPGFALAHFRVLTELMGGKAIEGEVR